MKLLVLDGNSILNRAFYGIKLLSTKSGEFTNGIYGFLTMLKKLLEETRESLKLVLESISNFMPEDFYSIDLMNAYASLGKILGEEVEEDLVNEIFGKFCLGK